MTRPLDSETMDIETEATKSSKDLDTIDELLGEMESWSYNLLDTLYHEPGAIDHWMPHRFVVNEKIDELVGDHTGNIGKEKILLAEKFTEVLLDFSQNVYFNKNIDAEKIQAFHLKINRLFFSSSPNILENLKGDLFKNILLTGRMYEVGGLHNSAHLQTGELSYELSYAGDKSYRILFDKVEGISTVDQIRIARELGRIAASALSEGTWAYPAYERSKELMREMLSSTSPIVRIVVEDALDQLGVYEARYLDSDSKKYNEILEKKRKRQQESGELLGYISLKPDIQDIYIEKTSEQYATISARSGDAPIGLVDISSIEKDKSSQFSQDELNTLVEFSQYISQGAEQVEIPLTKIIYNAISIENDLGADRFSLDPFIDPRHAENLRKCAQEVLDLRSKIQFQSTEIYHRVERENLGKTRELFTYFESLPFEKFNRHEQRAFGIYLDYKEKGYEEGMYHAITNLSSVANLVPDDLTELSWNLLGRIKDLEQFHISQWENLDQRIEDSIEALRDKIYLKETELFQIVTAFDREGFENWLRELIQEQESQKIPQRIQRFEDVIAPHIIGQDSIKEIADVMRLTLSRETQEFLNEKLSIQFENLCLKDQVYFSRFLIHADMGAFEEVGRVMNTSGLDNEKFIHTFLALAHGGDEISEKIVGLADKIPAKIANKIFEKYGEIVDSVDQVVSFAQQHFKKEVAIDSEAISEIQETLYKRALALINNFYDDIDEGDDLSQKIKKIETQLERIKSDTITTLAIFKQALRAGNKLPLEDIKGAIFESRQASDFSESDINEMKELYKVNWEHYEDQNVAREILDYFETAFDTGHIENNRLYIFKKDEHIRAFVRFEKKNDGTLYASALNVDQSMHGLSLGEAMMDEALRKEAEKSILRATSERTKKESMRYFEMGFVGTGFTQHANPLFHIEWDEEKNQQYQSKIMSRDELATMYLVEDEPAFEIHRASTLEELHQEFPEGKVMTRCFPDPVSGKGWYAVYEDALTDSETA